MIPILYIVDDSSDHINSVSTSAVVVDNVICDDIYDGGTVIQPLNEMPFYNLVVWTIINGFNMHKYAEAVIVKDYSKKDFYLTEKILDIAKFILKSEKMSSIGLVSLNGKRDFGEYLYSSSNSTDYSCILVSQKLGQRFKDKYSKDLFNKEILKSDLDSIIKDFSNFEMSAVK